MSEVQFPMAEVPFPVSDSRFDQKNEMFKRSVWDPTVKPLGDRFYREVVYRDRPGYRKVDYALRNASWDLEWDYGQGNAHAGLRSLCLGGHARQESATTWRPTAR